MPIASLDNPKEKVGENSDSMYWVDIAQHLEPNVCWKAVSQDIFNGMTVFSSDAYRIGILMMLLVNPIKLWVVEHGMGQIEKKSPQQR